MQSIDESAAGRLEQTALRARSLLGFGRSGGRDAGESTETGPRPLGTHDASLIASRITHNSSIDAAAAATIALDIVDHARTALTKLEDGDAALTHDEALALESVIHVRGRPAIRVLGARLESLEKHPGSELWQEFIANYEERIITVAALTGAAIATDMSSSFPPWVQGSAWLIAPHRAVTNRHVLESAADGVKLLDETASGAEPRLGPDVTITIDFTADDRSPSAKTRRRVTRVLYIANAKDPIDIAVLEIEPLERCVPLTLAAGAAPVPSNLFVVGHPALMSGVPSEVQAVFGTPDTRKRVSFGKPLIGTARHSEFIHDASTVGGYSGAPVAGISNGLVAGLHYYGDPVSGNMAITANAIRSHEAFRYFGTNNP